MKKFFKNCAMFIALAAMSLSLNAAAPGDDLTSSFVNADFAKGDTAWTVTATNRDKIIISAGNAGEYGFTSTFLKAESSKKFQNLNVSQVAENLPLGDYKVSATLFQDEVKDDGSHNYTRGKLHFAVNGVDKKAGNSSANGGAKVEIEARVINGKLKVEFKHDNAGNNHVLGFGDLKVVLKSVPELAPALATAETFADKKMLADYSARYAKAIAEAKAHSGVVDSAYMALCTEFETLNAVAQGSIDDFAAYGAAIAKAEAFVAASTAADKAAIEAIIAEHKANYEAAAQSPAAQGWVAALNLAVGQFDATYFVANADFTDGLNGWTLDTVAKQSGNHIVVEFLTKDTLNAGINGGIFFHDNKNNKQAFKNLKLSQTITGLPNGDYYLSMRMYADEAGSFGKGTVTLFANDKSKATKNNGELKVKVRVTDGTLNMAIESKDGRNGNFYFGNIKLQYVGFESWAKVSGSTATASCIEELVDAMKSTDYDSEDITIELTSGSEYILGNTAPEFNAPFKNLTFKSTAGAKVAGRLTPMLINAESLTFDGITFIAHPAGTAENYTSINFPKQGGDTGDSIKVLTIKNCTFQDLGKEQIIAHRGNDFKQMIETIIFTNNTINNYGVSQADGGNHPFQINKGCTNNFIMTENVFNNWAGKQFLNFGNMSTIVGSDSIITITVENNVFNGWDSYSVNHTDSTIATDSRNAHWFLEFSNNMSKGIKLDINNNLFFHNIIDSAENKYPVSAGINFTQALNDAYAANSEISLVGNLLIPDSVLNLRNINPAFEAAVELPSNAKDYIEKFKSFKRENKFQKDFPEFVYVPGEKMLTTHPMYTAGKDGKYIGLPTMYYDFAATATGATVSTAAGLIQAMGYTFEGVEHPVITMLDCTDEGGVYNVGTGYKKMGANANLTIKAAAGATPVVSGTLAGANYNMESLTIEGLKFIAGGNPIQMMNAKDSIDVLTVKNCVFEQFGAEQVGLFRAANGYLGKFVFVGNIVSEYGYGKQDGGNHAFQFNQSNFTIGGLEFTENQFIEYGGKQFINFSNAAPVAGSDSIMHINFSNNTLYGFSGNGWWADAAQYRNFIEFTCGSKYKWVGADITINNNLFYELNHTCDTLGIANRLALGTDGTSETYKVKVLNNVFYPDAMMTQVELGKTMEDCNLPIYDNENIKATRNDLTLAALGLTPETIWFKGEALAIPHTSPLMKAGVDGTYVGAKANYVKDTEGIPTVAYITTDQKMGEGAAATTNDPIYNYLNEGYDFNMVLVVVSDDKKADISANIDLTKYDAAIIAEQFAGDAAALMPDGPLAIAKLNIPTIYNKTYALRGDRALAGGKNYGGGADANVASIVVAKENQAWGVFDGIDFTKGDTIAIFKELTDDNGVVGANTKGINYVKGLDMLRAGKLADPAIADVSAVTACINYVPAGTTLAEGITTAAPMFIFGMNSGAISANNGENITEDGLKLWKNALNTLVGNIDETPRNLVGLKKVAYVTAEKEMAEGSEDAVLAALSADESLNVVKMFATDVNIEGFDAAIVQESLGGGDAILKPEGALGLANLSVPTIYNKLYAMKDGRAFTSVGKAATGKEAGETVLTITKTKESNLFEGVFAEGAKEAAMFVGTTNDTGAEGVKALNYAAGVENAGTQLAIPTGVADASVAINYIKAGEVLGDATLKTNVLTLGMNYGAINKPGNVTAANIQLWKNAVAIMTGAKELTIEDLPNALNAPVVLNKVFANNGVVYVNAAEAAVINVYSMTGSLVKSVEVKEGLNSINGLNAGQVYMIRCNDEVSKVIL
ncbi:MAG: hypothetical protein J6R12_01710 [Bacteroidales bacterium]|nr:hypothetical protein [Bacteroidales bacterium]